MRTKNKITQERLQNRRRNAKLIAINATNSHQIIIRELV